MHGDRVADVEFRPDHHGRRHAPGRLSLRGDPGRDLARRHVVTDASISSSTTRHRRWRSRTSQRRRPATRTRRTTSTTRRSACSALEPAQQGRAPRARSRSRSDENFQRFCSNYLATKRGGLQTGDIFFTNEEAQDWVSRTGTAWTRPASGRARQGRAGRRRRGVRREERQAQADLRHGAVQPREQRCDSRLRGARRALAATTRSSRRRTSAPRTVYHCAGRSSTCYIAKNTDALWNDEGHAVRVRGRRSRGERLLRLVRREASTDTRSSSSGCRTRSPPARSPTGPSSARRDFPGMAAPPLGPDPGRPAVGARPVGQRGEQRASARTSSTSSASRTLRMTSGRKVERRLPRRLRARRRRAPPTR